MGLFNTIAQIASPVYNAYDAITGGNDNNDILGSYAGAQAGTDPWLQQQFDYLMQQVGPKRTAKINQYQGDLASKLQYALSIAHDDEKMLYNQWMTQHPRPAPAAAETPNTDAAPPPIDQAKMAMAKQAAMDRAELNLRAQGLDPALYMDQISSQFDRAASTAELNSDPYSIYSDDIANNVVQAENNRLQQQFSTDFENRFGTAADRAAIPSTILDDAINTILGEQKTEAQLQLDRGQARGIYNDVGYNAGQAALGSAESAARAELGALGSGYVDQWRGNLNEIDDRAWNAYQSVPYGSTPFNLDPYIADRDEFIGRTRANAEGTLRGGLGGRNFFDFSKIGGSAGTAQGALNLRDTDVATAIGERKRLNTQSRGLGSQGAF